MLEKTQLSSKEKCFICGKDKEEKDLELYDFGNKQLVKLCMLCLKAQLDGNKQGTNWKKQTNSSMYLGENDAK